MNHNEPKTEIDTKQKLFVELCAQRQTLKMDSLPNRPISHEEVDSLAQAFAKKNNGCEAWILDPYNIGPGENKVRYGDRVVDSSEAVVAFGLLIGEKWIPFEFGTKHWYRKTMVSHPESVEMDEEIQVGSMTQISEIRN